MYTEEQKATYNKVKIHQLINFDIEPENPIKVSIVIPVCNVEQYLTECLNSAVNQTLGDIEIICVNDGSKDSSLEILLDYARRDSRVKVIDKDNAGYGHTMNLGMDMASGEYIGIIESDDYVDLHMYEDLYQIAQENRLDWVKADFNRFVVEKGVIVNTYNDVAKKKEYYNRVISPQEEPFSFRFIMNTWSGIYSRQFLVSNNIRHQETLGASFQDNGFWFQSMIYAKRVYVVNKPYYMNRRDNPNSSVYSKGKAEAIIEEYNYIYHILEKDENKLLFFAPQYQLKKYHNYLFHYNRIANEEKLAFLEKVSEEFKLALSKGEIDPEFFNSHELDEVEWIANNPKDYFFQHNDESIAVSVIIPVYNAAPYLKKCLDSVLDQELENIEVICIDDGSEDESLKILNDYADTDSRLVVLTQDNAGGGAARNRGLDIARGEYLLFLDADDFFEKELAETVYHACKKKSADVCIYRVKTYDDKTGKVTSEKGSFVKENMPKKDVFAPQDMRGKIFITFQTWPWNKMFRRHFIEKEKIRFQEIKRTNDLFFTYSALMKAARITTVDRELVYYRIGNPNSCQSTNEDAPVDFAKALMKLYEEIEAVEEYEIFKKSWFNLLVRSCMYNLNKQNDSASYLYVYNFLHDELLPATGLLEMDPADIWKVNADDYKECLKITNQTFDAYMLDKLRWYRNETAQLQRRIESTRGIVSENFAREVMTSRNQSEQEIIRLKDENTRLQLELMETRTSMSCRIGLAVTFLPRKIARLIGGGGQGETLGSGTLKKNFINNRVHIVYITDETYLMPTAVSLSSMKMNKNRKSEYIVHIFAREISEDAKLKLRSMEENKFKIDIIDISLDDAFLNYTKADGDLHVTPSAILKFQIPSVLKDVDKVIYIDGDTIVQGDLCELYNIDITHSYIAAVKDVISERNPGHLKSIGFLGKYYFNSGVMLMNLSKMRAEQVSGKLFDYRLHGKNHFMDQDALNQVFRDNVLFVSPRFNFLNKFYEWWSRDKLEAFYGEAFDENLEKALEKAVIIHFGSHEKPWIYEMGICSDIFMKYYGASPYRNVERKLIKNKNDNEP